MQSIQFIFSEDKLIGDNTDAAGFLADLKKFIGNRELEIEKSILVLGAGGSARAIVYDLLNDGWKISISSRRVEQAQELALSFPKYKSRITVHELQNLSTLQLSTFNLIVNTTPIRHGSKYRSISLATRDGISFNAMIYDLVYNPRETKLVKDACAQGLSATTGLGMLIEQAALAFEIWTGYNPPREILWKAIDN